MPGALKRFSDVTDVAAFGGTPESGLGSAVTVLFDHLSDRLGFLALQPRAVSARVRAFAYNLN